MKASILNLTGIYYRLIKPERTITNTVTAIAGFLFASQWHINWRIFLYLIAGLTLVIASACVMNNLVDKDLDRSMARTKDRALPSGQVPASVSIIFASLLGLAGFWLLTYINWLTVAIVAVAYFVYVVVYGFAKRHTVHSTLIGTVPGGASLVAGYTAYTDQLDRAVVILFLIMLSWQMVHFYAIAIYRLKDYATAKMPIWPAKKGVESTKRYMLAYLVLFIFVASLLTWFDYTGYIYLVVVVLMGAFWLQNILIGLRLKDSRQWARGVFKYSLVVLMVISAAVAVGPILP